MITQWQNCSICESQMRVSACYIQSMRKQHAIGATAAECCLHSSSCPVAAVCQTVVNWHPQIVALSALS